MRRLLPVLLTATLLSGCGLSMQNLPIGRSPDGPTYHVTAVFADASNVPIGGMVKIGQATVGRVSSIDTRDFQAVVGLEITADTVLSPGTTAQLQLTSALGEEFVDLRPPATPAPGEPLRDGDVIPLSATSRGPDVENMLAAVGGLLNGSGLDHVRTIVTELNTMLGGREDEVRDLLHQLDGVLASLDSHGTQIAGLIDSMNTLAADTAAQRPLLEAALTDITPALQVLISQRDQFTGLLTKVTALSTSANGILGETGQAFTTQLKQLRPVLDSLSAFDKRLEPTLAQLTKFGGLLDRAVPGDYLKVDMTLDVPNSILQLIQSTGGLPLPVPLGGGVR